MIVTEISQAVEFRQGDRLPADRSTGVSLGGTGGGICANEEELIETVAPAFATALSASAWSR